MNLRKFFAELRRRNVYKVGIADVVKLGRVSQQNFLPKFRIAVPSRSSSRRASKGAAIAAKKFLIFCLQFLGECSFSEKL
jgi:hypothetical protein